MVVAPALAVVVVQLAVFPLPAGAWLQGLVVGLLNALVVLGLMLVYRANRVLNLAQASIGAFPAALGVGVVLFGGLGAAASLGFGAAAAVVAAGAVLVLGRRRPVTAVVAGLVTLGVVAGGLLLLGHAGYVGGLIIGLVTAAVVGLGVDLVVVQRFRRAPRLILTVATIGLAQLFAVGALLVPRLWGRDLLVREGSGAGYRAPFTLHITIGQQVFRQDDLVAVVVAVVCLVAVTLLLRRSDVGTAVRAAADRSDRAAMLGVPVLRIEAVVWVVAAVLSFLQGAILGFPLSASVGLSTLVVALAAMALGGFGDLPTTLLAAVAIGILDAGVAWNNGTRPLMVYAVLAVVVMVGLLVRRAARDRADSDEVSTWQASTEPRPVPAELRRLPEVVATRWIGGAVLLTLAVALPRWAGPSLEFRAATIATLAVLALSIVVLTGWAGEVTLGQMGFAAVGAAVGAVATGTWHLDLTIALLVAGASGAAAAVLIGLPSLRLHGMFLAVTTLAFGLAATGFLLNPTEATWIPAGELARRRLLGVWSLEGGGAMYEVCLAVLVLALVATAGIRRTRSGRVLRAVRDNPRGAQAFGVRALAARLTAFALSGFLAAAAGCLLVYVNRGYDVTTFAPEQGLNTFVSAVVGGVGSAVGAILGAVVLDGSRNVLTGPWVLLPSAVGVLVVLLVLPGGLAELAYRLRDALLRRVAARRDLVVPSLVADVADGTGPGLPRASVDRPEQPGWLSVRGLDVAYDGVQVLFGVDLDIAEGSITALLGTNGAGKSTLLRAIGGVAPVTAGQVHLGSVDLRALRPEEIAARGVAQMPGGQGVFPSLTVDENLRVAAWLLRRRPADVAARVAEVQARFPVLAERGGDRVANLSGGQQQQLALGMALLARPKLLLVDELSLGLAPTLVAQLMDQLRLLRDQGTTIVVVEQSVNLALAMADHAYFMEKGEVRFSGPAADLLDQPDLVRAVYLHGAEAGLRGPDDRRAVAGAAGSASGNGASLASERPAALAVDGLSVSFGGIAAVRDVAFEVAEGETVGIIGPNGAGKTTVFDLISGFTAADAGRVRLHGRDVFGHSAAWRARAGLGRSFQDARLFPGLTVAETIAVALERWIDVGDPFNAMFRMPSLQSTEAAVAARVEELIDVFGLGSLRSKTVRELSTGSRRMVDLACVVAHGPTVVLLDEPSSGIAQREAEALGPVLHRMRDQLGASLLIVEHDMSLITTVADRLVALDQGSVVTSGSPAEVLEHPQVVAAYLGTDASAHHRSDLAREPTQGAGLP